MSKLKSISLWLIQSKIKWYLLLVYACHVAFRAVNIWYGDWHNPIFHPQGLYYYPNTTFPSFVYWTSSGLLPDTFTYKFHWFCYQWSHYEWTVPVSWAFFSVIAMLVIGAYLMEGYYIDKAEAIV